MKSISFAVARCAFLPDEKSVLASDLAFVPAMLRRRLSPLEKLAVAAVRKVEPQEGTHVPVVFASRFGEIQKTEKLMRQFIEEGEISPAGFSFSVHNAAPAVYSLVSKNEKSYTALSGGERTLETGLLDALVAELPAIFVYAEESCPTIFENEAEVAGTPPCALALFLEDGDDFSLFHEGNLTATPLSAKALNAFFTEKTSQEIATKNFTISRKFNR